MRFRTARSVLSVLSAVSLAATLVVGPGAATGAAEAPRPCGDAPRTDVTTGAVFNDPAGGDATAVVRRICDLVHRAEPGSQIKIAHFVISGDAGVDFAAELIDAHRRGVDVRVLLDGWQVDNPAVEALDAELGTDTTRGSWLHVCGNTSPEGNTAACIGNKGQHNKFYLFSRTGGESDVVVQSSANFTDLNSSTYWNNAATFVGNSRLYAAYESYFGDLVEERQTPDYDRTITTGMRGGSVTADFFPKATGDPIEDFLGKVGCAGDTVIRIGMSEWDGYRIGIAERVAKLADRGCRVRIVRGLMDDGIADLLEGRDGVTMRTLDSAGELPGRVHSKYLVVSGEIDGEPDSRRLLTGSPNFNHTSLRRNDEAMVTTNVRTVHEAYVDNFERMFAAAR